MRSSQQKDNALLWCLRRAPDGIRVAELSEVTGMWMSSIYPRLARLERQGLVRWEFVKTAPPRGVLYFATTQENNNA